MSSGSTASQSGEHKLERGRVRSVSVSEHREDEYKLQVVTRIQGLVRQFEVRGSLCTNLRLFQVIHDKEERHMRKQMEQHMLEFKKKQELELQGFLKKQGEDAWGWQRSQEGAFDELKARHSRVTMGR